MSPRSKKEYLDAIFLRYKSVTKREKTNILNEFCQTCGYHRKHAIRVLRNHKRFTKPTPKKRGKEPIYNDNEIIVALKRIWLKANLPCSKRLKAILLLWLPSYEKKYGKLSEKTFNALMKISPSTMDRLLKPTRVKYRKRGRCTTKPGTLLRKQIPINTNQWVETQPGFLEADSVAHCGESLLGMFTYTIDFVDIATGWTEQRAVWGKGEHGVKEQVKDVENSLPFDLLGFDSDNGSEFLNYHLLSYLQKREKPIQFTRSRPYHKDDNAHIEQKNWTHVRQWLGYDRLDNPDVVPLMNKLYKSEWRLFLNLFCPSMKLISKDRIGSKTIKKHDNPKTPYQRILESEKVSEATKNNLKEIFNKLNPFELRDAIEKKLKKIFVVNRNPKRNIS